MFWFCKPKPVDVYFYTTREDVFNHARPKRASNFLPDWWKNLPRKLTYEGSETPLFPSSTLKGCPAFTNLYTSGFMFPMWSDLNVEVDGDNFRYQFADRTSSLSPHPKAQFGACDLLDKYLHLKILNPWLAQSKSKVNFLAVPPTWNNFGHDDVVVLPGSYGFRQFTFANINLLFKKAPQKIVHSLLFGQPVLHMVPITDRPIRLHYDLVSDAEMAKIKSKSPVLMMWDNRYRRSEKICPHAE